MKTRAIKIVALFDILGIKKRMDVMGIDGVLTDYERLTSFVDQQTGCLVIRSVPAGDGGFCPAVGCLEIQQAYFSDTFILWMDYDAFRLPAFFEMCCDLFCHSLSLGIPIRGGIGVGDAHMDKKKSIYLGPALIDAALAESAQLWLGVSCGVTFNQDEYRGPLDPRTVLAYKEHQNPEKQYKIPGLVLDWPRRWRTSRSDDRKKQLDSMNTDQSFALYYLNAIRFIDYSEKSHDWFMRKESLE